MKKKKIIGIAISSILVILILGLSFVGNYFYNLALNPDTPKDIVFGTPEEAEATSGQVLDSDIQWLLTESNYTDETLTSFDNLNLHAYKVFTVHGYTSEGINMSSYAKNYYDIGYNVLIPDLRSHGLSEGDYIGMGWDDRLDIIDWINTILEYNPNAEIVLHGVSMGAATVSMVSGEDLPSNVKAIVADCGYTSVWDEFAYQLDDFVPYYMMEELYNATSSEKEMLTIKNAGHAKASEVDPETYWTTVSNFTSKYITQ